MSAREQLAAAGLARRAEELLALGVDSVRLVHDVRGRGQPPRLAVTVTRLSLNAVAIASGGTHWLALRDEGTVAAWGYNDRGQLGDGTRAESKDPVAVKKLDGVVAVAAGDRHSVALRDDATVFAWGENEYGQLGDGSRKLRNKPVAVRGLEGDVRAIAAGHRASYALRTDGSVVGWGLNVAPDYVGRAAIPERPVAVSGLERGIVALASGRSSALALTEDGAVLQWGSAQRPDGSVFYRAPEAVAGIDGRVVAIAAGSSHALALTVAGRVLAWGDSSLGALGVDASTVPDGAIVQTIEGNAIAIAAAHGASVVLTRDGEILRWGSIVGSSMPTLKRPTRLDVDRGSADIVAIAPESALTAHGDVLWWHGAPAGNGGDASTAATDPAAAVATSRLGGNPDLAPNTPWPHSDGRPLAFVAQIDLAEIASLGCAPPLPEDGLLSLFVASSDVGFANTFTLLYAPASAPLAPAQPPHRLADGDRFAALALRPQRERSLPPPTARAIERLGLSEVEAAAYTELVIDSDHPLHRVLGHPALIQPPDPRDDDPDLTLVLQIDSDDANGMYWGDCGRLYVWMKADDLAARRFEHATLLFDQ